VDRRCDCSRRRSRHVIAIVSLSASLNSNNHTAKVDDRSSSGRSRRATVAGFQSRIESSHCTAWFYTVGEIPSGCHTSERCVDASRE
jgi:hypothetical protein